MIHEINTILGRTEIYTQICNILTAFDKNHTDITFKKGIYIYGAPGIGKTALVCSALTQLNIDAVKYDAGDIRNKALIESIASNNISNCNVLDMMRAKRRRIAIVMDEIDGMNGGDKGGITSLIKLIRQKKTRKQKLENVTLNPIICIGGCIADKKIKELMKVCHTYELKAPTPVQIAKLVDYFIPGLAVTPEVRADIMKYIQYDIRKIAFIKSIFTTDPSMLSTPGLFTRVLFPVCCIEDAKRCTQHIMQTDVSLKDHTHLLSETDRTIVSLLYHENIADTVLKVPPAQRIPFYADILNNICFADYIDRVTFQNQIWIFNEMSSILKTFYSNRKYHIAFPKTAAAQTPGEMRFTKILTKYSTEYNNSVFMHGLCRNLGLDRWDVFAFFKEVRAKQDAKFLTNTDVFAQFVRSVEPFGVSRLDVRRIYRYMDKNVVATDSGTESEYGDGDTEKDG